VKEADVHDTSTIAEIEHSFFEYRANFKQPMVSLLKSELHGETVAALYKALAPWAVGLENIIWNQAAKSLGEVQLGVTVPSLFAGIQVGVGGLVMNVVNPDWTRAPQILSLFQTALDTLRGTIVEELQSQETALGFHVRPGRKPFREIVTQFVNSKLLESEDAKMFGVSVYYGDSSFVIDSSAVLPDGVFIRLTRSFPELVSFEEMAGIIYRDEESVLRRLGLKLQ